MRYFIFFIFIISFSTSAQEKFEGGPFEVYFENGNLKTKGQYKNNNRVGGWKGYYKTGELRTEFSYNSKGKRTRLYKQYFKDGTTMYEVKKVDKKFIETKYYESGGVFFERILENGYYKEYYEDGTLKVTSNYVDSELSGTWTQFNKTGEKEWEVTYQYGYKHGEYKCYYRNGKLKILGNYKRDKKEGKEERYYENGQLKAKGFNFNGVFNKKWVLFNDAGLELDEKKFKNGVQTSTKTNKQLKSISVPDGVIERFPIYPRCKEVIGNNAQKECFSNSISSIILTNFNVNLAKSLGLKGRHSIYVTFKINKEGNVSDVRVKSPHPGLKTEAIRVVNIIPKMTPGTVRGEAVEVPFSQPIIFDTK